MIWTGETDFIRWMEDEEGGEIGIPLSIEWSCEKSECGDGRIDWDWAFVARDSDDKIVQLEEKEEIQLIETLKNEGALA